MKHLFISLLLYITVFGVNFELDGLGNIIGYDEPSYNIITENDDLGVVEAKQNEQIKITLFKILY